MPKYTDSNPASSPFHDWSDERLKLRCGILEQEIYWAKEDGQDARVSELKIELAKVQLEQKNRRTPKTYTRLPDFQTPRLADCQTARPAGISGVPVFTGVTGTINDSHEEIVSRREVSRDPSLLEQGERGLWEQGHYGELDLVTFMRFAIEADRSACREKGHAPTWELARYCKAYPPFALLGGEEVFDIIEPFLENIYTVQDQENFVFHFKKVRFAAGEGVLDRALRLAQQRPLRSTKRILYDRFVSMIGWLQNDCGPNNIWLPQKNVAEVLGVTQATVSNMIHNAMDDGYLTFVKEAIPHRLAAEYRFNVDKFPVLKERQ
jgi:hypothetical protein